MKKALPACLLAAAVLNSCSLLQRAPEEAPVVQRDGMEAPFAPEGGGAATPVADLAPSYEAEISRLSTKVAALETKVDVLTANLERAQLKNAQPVIDASPVSASPLAAAPVATSLVTNTSAAPATTLPGDVKAPAATETPAEKDFAGAMELFRAGQYLEASSQFALLSKKYPRHLLAGHALYWAGEASARGEQWALAIQNWKELEQNFPRSAHLPEALAGMARAYEKQGDVAHARAYKDSLLRSFPKSPVALALNAGGAEGPARGPRAEFNESEEAAPVYEEPSSGEGAAE